MDLQQVAVKHGNFNLLHDSIHPRHGLVWTDGQSIFLAPVQIADGDVVNNGSQKLGQFDIHEDNITSSDTHDVKSLSWSGDVQPGVCFLSVVHPQHVAVWRVEGELPSLGFKQVRKLNVQPVSKGCLWNPTCDVLCILSKQQCSFFFRHTDNKGSYAFPALECGNIHCGCWSKDGNKLVVCMDSTLLVYVWSDLKNNISKMRQFAWKVPTIEGCIRSVVAISSDYIVCAAEKPLNNLYNPPPDVFLTSSAKEATDQGDIISPSTNGSIKESLMNLPRNPESLVEDTSKLVVVRLRNKKNPLLVSTEAVDDILSPDLLVYVENVKKIVVGNATNNHLNVFTLDVSLLKVSEIVLDNEERPYGLSCVNGDKSYQGIFLAIGKKLSTGVFMATPKPTMDLKVKYCQLPSESKSKEPFKVATDLQCASSEEESPRDYQEKTISSIETLAQNTNSSENSGKSGLKKQSKLVSHPSMDLAVKSQKTLSELRDYSDSEISPRDTFLGQSPRLAVAEKDNEDCAITLFVNGNSSKKENTCGITVMDEADGGNTCTNDLEVERTDFDKQPPTFAQPDLRCLRDSVNVDKVRSTCAKNNGRIEKPKRNGNPKKVDADKENTKLRQGEEQDFSAQQIDLFEKQLLEQQKHIENLQKTVDSLARTVDETSLVFPTKYQSMQKPEKINVVCKDANQNNKKSFLLDNGRLKLQTIKHAFNLEYVEVYFDDDDDPCIVTANIDGYIPLRFEPFTTIRISGPSRELYRDTSSEDLGIDGVDLEPA